MDHAFQNGFTLYVRTDYAPEAIVTPVRKILRSLDPGLPFVEVHTLREEVETSLWQERLLATLSSIFGAAAVLFASIGLYGTLNFTVNTRMREIGIRAALGAEPSRIARMLRVETAVLVIAGVAAGLAAYAFLAQWIHYLLYDVQPTSPVALTSALAVVIVASGIASLVPIMRATRVAPATALRHD
jgi:ABC-type antimicrobial peptide transport system permease subunit